MAASIIDSFFVSLGLDGTLFKRGMKDAEAAQDRLDDVVDKSNKKRDKDDKSNADKRNKRRKDQDTADRRSNADREKQEKAMADARRKRDKELETQGKKTADGYKKFRNELLALGAVFTAGMGIKDFITNTVNSAANLGYLSENLRMSTRDVTAWQRASERAGGSAEGITAQLRESADTLAQLKNGFGPSESLQNFFRFGGSADDLKDGNTYLLARSKIIAGMFKQDPTKAAFIAKQMGVSDDQFNFLKQGPDAVMVLVRAQEKNAAITAKDAEAARVLRNRFLDLRDSLTSTGTRVAVQLIPVLDDIIKRLEKGSQWVADHKEDISKWLDGTIKWVREFAHDVDKAADAVGGWQTVLIGLAAIKALSMAAGFVQLAASLLQIGSALGGISAAGAAVGLLGRLGLVGAAGAVGYGAGTLISDALPTSTNDKIGEFLARGAALMGVKDARDAINFNDNKGRSASGKITGPYAPKAGGARSRGERNNNPGNIEYGPMALANGAVGSDGRFAKFGSAQDGLNAMATLLSSYGRRGINSINGIVSKYAPGHENNVNAYVSDVSRRTGFKPGATLDMGDPKVLASVMSAMARHETGRTYGNDILAAAAERAIAKNSAKVANVTNARAVGDVARSAVNNSTAVTNSRNSTSTTEVKIDNITVNTKATDAQGIATAIRPAVEKYTFATQANTGMR